MKNKGLVGLIVAVVVILIIIVFYNYNQISDNPNLNQANQFNRSIVQGPAVKVSPAVFDLGTVVYWEVAKHIFTVENLGDAPLKILRLSTSCGCTKAVMEEKDKEIASGQTVKVEVTFDPAVHKDDTDVGELKRVIYIGTDEPSNPEIEAEFSATVIKK